MELAGVPTCFLVLELIYGKTTVGPVVQLVGSIPGKEDTIRYHWDLQRGVMDGPTMTDIVNKLDALATEAILTYHGSQGVLPLA